jgi:hypothetical protein
MFNIDNDEKQRILSLHENSTRKQYLNLIVEQEQFYKGSDGKVGKLVGPQVLPAGATKITQQEYDTAMKTQQKPDDASAAFEKWYNESMGLSTFKTLITNNNANGIMEILNYNFKDKPDYITKFKELLVAKHPTLKFNEQPNNTWLKYLNDKTYEYLKKDNKWFARRVGTTKEFDLSSNPKYVKTVENLNRQFPDGKTPAGGEVKTDASATNVAVKNETLPGAPVYYPWIQDGKVNTEKLKQSVEDNSIYKWTDELKKLTPEQLTKVSKDFVSSGIPDNLTTTKGTGIRLAVNDVIKTAEKMVANTQPQGEVKAATGGDGSPAIVGGEQTSLESL